MNHPPTLKQIAAAILPTMLAVALSTGVAQAKPKSVTATYANNMLSLNIKSSDNEVIIYDDAMNQELGRLTPSKGVANFMLHDVPVVPCRVRVESGGKALIKPVKGVDCKGKKEPPVCKITQPIGLQAISNGGTLSFSGAIARSKSRYLQYEWDFGGGADARPTKKDTGPVVFNYAKDTTLWVTFTASDITGARCSDRIQVKVGSPAANLPDKVAEQPPKVGDGEHVVLPFQPYGMAFHDLSYGLYSQLTPTNWINATVIQKGSVGGDKPIFLGPNDTVVKYSAASNPTDPIGSDSINSTSQNYPLGDVYGDAVVKKSDWFDPCKVWKNPNANETTAGDTQFVSFFETYIKQKPYDWRATDPRPGAGAVAGVSGDLTNAECNLSNFFYPIWDSKLAPYELGNPKAWAYLYLLPDEGAAFWTYDLINRFDGANKRPGGTEFTGFRGVMEPNGVPMPGRDDAYKANEPQAFPSNLQAETGDNYSGYDQESNKFAANGLPTFPTDDKGRHNPFPMMRIQAHDKGGKILATTDTVTAVTTEFKCAECHTKGKVGADQDVYEGLRTDMKANKVGLEKYKGLEKWIPVFVSPTDVNAQRPNDRDVIEQAAMINIARLHDFYYNFIEESGWLGPLEFESEQLYGKKGEVRAQPGNCTDYCHKSVPHADPRRYNMSPNNDVGSACPEYSDSNHNIHGRLIGTMDSNYVGSIERDPVNRELKLADLSVDNKNKTFLLSAKDSGTPDSSCFFCHAGRQDKYQRDVMTAAGVNCIDCHGDLSVLAGGGAMVSRGTGDSHIDSRSPPDYTAAIDKDKLAKAYMSERSSYGPKADGTYYLLEKGTDGVYRRKEKDQNGNVTETVVTTLEMALNFAKGTGVDNGNGTYTLTKDNTVETLTEAQLLDKVKKSVNGWILEFVRIPWAEELSCANCHTGEGDTPVRRRSYDMTTGTFKLQEVKNERFAENLLPKKHDSSFTLLVQDGQSCPPGTYSDTLSEDGQHVCVRGLFKDSVDRHGLVACEACHGATHAVWPNPNPYANDNVTAIQLQGHTGTILECNVCHTDDAFKNGAVDGVRYGTGVLAGPHNMHPVNDKYWWKDTAGTGNNGGYHNQFAKKPGMNGEADQCATCHGADHKGTRLSKTPVDRTFTNGKGKPVKVKAGQFVSCDLCHTLEQSFPKK